MYQTYFPAFAVLLGSGVVCYAKIAALKHHANLYRGE